MFKLYNNCPKDNVFLKMASFYKFILIANNFSSYICFVPGLAAKLFGSLPDTYRSLYGISLK